MPPYTDLEGQQAPPPFRKCFFCFGLFAVGVLSGLLIALVCLRHPEPKSDFVSFVQRQEEQDIVVDGVLWGGRVERNIPNGYNDQEWDKFVEKDAAAVKLEKGCGRMQNRMVVFKDGQRGCVRYRQNTDQIQGEIFSYYLGQLLQLPNLAPTTLTIVDLHTPLWSSVSSDILAAQWTSKPVVITKYVPNLMHAAIPALFKPIEKHLNKNDIANITTNEELVELAQWSDLIVFDYLTANLDRIVNNLYNFQWNVNIMDAPAHNLAKSLDGLLLFLDNESGLLHGYRLLKKYEVYHQMLLENLCVFREGTVATLRRLKEDKNVGELLREKFEMNSDRVKDLLPMLPDKSVKILNERIEKVFQQIQRCEAMFQ